MTATDELRRMLDERGVEHFDGTETTLWGYEPAGKYTGAYRFAADETSGGRMQVRMFNVTPEQAIEATLWRGTCKPVDGYDDDGEEIGTCCSECGSPWPVYYVVRYCPVCGAKVVDDASVD